MSKVSGANARFRLLAERLRTPQNESKGSLPFAEGFKAIPEKDKYKDLKDWKFFPGDRVMITKGKGKGMITSVLSYVESANKISVDAAPSKLEIIPRALWEENTASYVHRQPILYEPSDLKLVVKMEDDAGKEKDVIVHKFDFEGLHFNKDYQCYMPTRVVRDKGETLVLPWPAPKLPLKRTAAAGEDENSERTYFVDSAVRNQIPEGALRDIRNPRSKYRRGVFEQRHLNRFLAPQMPLTEARKAYLESLKNIKTEDKLTDDVKEMIGAKVKAYIESQKKELGV